MFVMEKSRPVFRFSMEGRPAWSLYPLYSPTPFCDLIKHSKKGIERCVKSDREASKIVLQCKRPLIYECHAGLTDGIIPIIVDDEPIAFLMFGQFLTEEATEEKFGEIWERIKDLELPYEEVKEAFLQLPTVPRHYVESFAWGIFEAVKEVLESIPPTLITDEKRKILDIDAKIWLIQQQWQILRVSKQERELLSLFQWANRETVLRYWSEWVREQLKSFDEAPRETKSRIWGTITSLLSHLRVFQASSKINLLEFYSHYASLVKRCESKEELSEILGWIMNDLLFIRGQTKYRASIVERAKSYILQNYGKEGLCLKDVAKALRISPYYLSHLFKDSEGMSIGEYIRDIRIARAKELLESSGLSVIEVGLEVGYSDPAYFSKIFRKETGLSPSQYRRKIKQNITK